MKLSKNGVCEDCLDFTILYKSKNLWFCYRCHQKRRQCRRMMTDNKVDKELDNPF